MKPLYAKILCIAALALTLAASAAQAQLTPSERDAIRRETRREMQRERDAEEWRRHNERYFGPGIYIERNPNEDYDRYTQRVQQRCNEQWTRCSTACMNNPDSNYRNVCAANCNNELAECRRND